MSLENDQSKVIQGRFHLIKKLGAGSFGEIFEAKDLKTGKVYACKAESTRTKHPQLRLEYQIYRTLAQSKYFVRVWGFVTHYNHQIMIMDKLGDSLEQLFTQCGRKFSIRCVCAIAIQILSRIEELHKHNYLHRDIKPDNFLIGHTSGGDLTSKEAGKIYMIDLGLGKVWKEGGRHIPEKHGKRLIGTPRYASINTHFGQEQSRRDDLESLGYMLMYFAVGQLPWQGLRGQTKEEKYQKIGQKKRDTRLTELCSGYPDEFRRYLSATQKLQFQEDPPYDQYKQWFRDVLNRHQKTGSYDFDWQNRYYSKQHSKSSSSKRRSSRQHVNNAAAQQPPPQQPQNQAPPTRQQAPPPNQSNQPPPNPVRRNTNNNTNTRGVNINTNPNTIQQPQQPPNTTLVPQIHHSNTRNNTNYLSNSRHPTQHHSNHHSSTRRPPTCQQPIHSHSRPQTTANPATAVYPHNTANNPLSLPPLQSNNVIPLIQQNVTTANPQFSNYNIMDRYQRCKTFFNKQSNNHPQIGINPLTRNTSVNSNSPILQINANATNNINHAVPTNNNSTTQRGNMMFSNPTSTNINTSNQNKTLIRDYAKLCSAYKQLEADNMATTRENAELKQELNKLRTEKHNLSQQCHAWKQRDNEKQLQMTNYARVNAQLKKEKNKQEQTIRTLQHQLNALYGQHQHQHQRQQVVDTRQPRVYNTSVAQPAQKRRKLNNGMQRRSSNNHL